MHKFILRPKSIAESALDGHFSPSPAAAPHPNDDHRANIAPHAERVGESNRAPNEPAREPARAETCLTLSRESINRGNEQDTMKNTLREAVWGPSLVLLAIGAVTFGGCRAKTSLAGSGNPATTDNLVGELPVVQPAPGTPAPGTMDFQITASASKTTVKLGEPIELQITLKNTRAAPMALEFSSGQSFDFQAFAPGSSDAAWTWSADKGFAAVLRSLTLAPGAELKFKTRWNNAPRGRYTICGLVTANGGLRAEAFEVVVE